MKRAWAVVVGVGAIAGWACGSDNGSGPSTSSFQQEMCVRSTVTIGQTVNGTLASTDCRVPVDSTYFEAYRLNPVADTTIDLYMSSTEFDTYLWLLRLRSGVENVDSLEVVGTDDDSGGGPNGTNSLMSNVALSAGEKYLVIANGYARTDLGAYALAVVP